MTLLFPSRPRLAGLVPGPFAGAVLGSLAAKIGTGLSQLACTYLFAASMPERELAWFLLLVAGVTFVGTLGTGGAAEAGIRFVGRALKGGDDLVLARTITSALALALGLSSGLALIVVPATTTVLSHGSPTAGAPPSWALVLAALSIPAFAVRIVAVGLIRGLGAVTLASVFEGTLLNGLLAVCAASMLVTNTVSFWTASLAFTGVSLVAVVLALGAIGRLALAASGEKLRFALPGFGLCREFLIVGAPLLAATILGLLVSQMMIWLVAWLGTARDVAAFGLGWQLFQVVNALAMVGQTSLAPRLAALAMEERRDALFHLLPSSAALLTAGTVAALASVLVGSAVLDWLVAPEVSRGATVVALLLGLGLCGKLLLGVNTTTLAMIGGEREVWRAARACGAVTLLLAPPSFLVAGTVGLAALGGLYSVGYGAMTAWAVRQRLGFWPMARLRIDTASTQQRERA